MFFGFLGNGDASSVKPPQGTVAEVELGEFTEILGRKTRVCGEGILQASQPRTFSDASHEQGWPLPRTTCVSESTEEENTGVPGDSIGPVSDS